MTLGDTMSIHSCPWCLVDTLPKMQNILSVEWRPSKKTHIRLKARLCYSFRVLGGIIVLPNGTVISPLIFPHCGQCFLALRARAQNIVCFVGVMLPFCFLKRVWLVRILIFSSLGGVSGRNNNWHGESVFSLCLSKLSCMCFLLGFSTTSTMN